MGLNKNTPADLNESFDDFDVFPRPIKQPQKNSSFPYIHSLRRSSNVKKNNIINVQSYDDCRTISGSGGLPPQRNGSLSSKDRQFSARSVNGFAKSRNITNIKKIKNEILMSPSSLSADIIDHSFDVDADIHSINRECLSSKSTKSAPTRKRSAFLKNGTTLGKLLKPLRFHRKFSEPLPTPVHSINISSRNLAAKTVKPVSSHNVRDKPANLNESADLSSILNIISNEPKNDTFEMAPLEVEDLRRLPKLSRSPNFNALPPPEIQLRPGLSFLTTESTVQKKGKNRKNSVSVDISEPGPIFAEDLECWMSKLPQALLEVPLNQLLIPGSHDSFSYSLEWGDIAPDTPDVVGRLATLAPCVAKPAIMRWSVTQNSQAHLQLRHGIRYFDIRVALKNSRFHFVHGLYGADLEPILEQIRDFLTNRKGEVVFLDFQHLHGLLEEDHKLLIDMISTTFDGLILPKQYDISSVSLQFLLKNNYQVLVFYRHPEGMYEENLWSSHSLPNPWPQATSISSMFNFITSKIAMRPRDAFFVTQCILTPSYSYLIKNITGTLEKKMAKPCNKAVVEWLKGITVGPAGPNIVMTDFVDQDNWAVSRTVILRNHASLDLS